jgi:hypothetical protein
MWKKLLRLFLVLQIILFASALLNSPYPNHSDSTINLAEEYLLNAIPSTIYRSVLYQLVRLIDILFVDIMKPVKEGIRTEASNPTGGIELHYRHNFNYN